MSDSALMARASVGVEVGALAPTFAAIDILGRRFHLSGYADRRVLLSFASGLVGAVARARALASRAAEWRARGVDVVVVAHADLDALRAAVDGARWSLLIVADASGHLLRLYGLSRAAHQAPTFDSADVLIDGAGRVAFVHRGEMGADAFALDRIDAALTPRRASRARRAPLASGP